MRFNVSVEKCIKTIDNVKQKAKSGILYR